MPISATLLRLYRQKRREGAKPSIKDHGSITSAASSGLAHFSVIELTRDHHPDRDDERSRVESAGGYVLEWAGVSRVNGELAVSRAIGDVPFKRCHTIRTKLKLLHYSLSALSHINSLFYLQKGCCNYITTLCVSMFVSDCF